MFAREEERAVIKDRREGTGNPQAMRIVSVIRLYRRKKSKPDSWVVYFFDHGSGYFKHLFKDEEVTQAWQTLNIHSGGWVKETRSVFWFRKIILPEMEGKIRFGEWVRVPRVPFKKRKKKVHALLDHSRIEHRQEALFRLLTKSRERHKRLVDKMFQIFFDASDMYAYSGKWDRIVRSKKYPTKELRFLNEVVDKVDPERRRYLGVNLKPGNQRGIFEKNDFTLLRRLMRDILESEKIVEIIFKEREIVLEKMRFMGRGKPQ